MKDRAGRHIFETGAPKFHHCKDWSNLYVCKGGVFTQTICKLITYVMLSSKCNYNSNYSSMVENYMNGFVGSLDRHVLLPMFYL